MYERCLKCGRRLTDKKSMKLGYGPICWQKYMWGEDKMLKKGADGEDVTDSPGQMNIFDFPELLPERNSYGEKRKGYSKDSNTL